MATSSRFFDDEEESREYLPYRYQLVWQCRAMFKCSMVANIRHFAYIAFDSFFLKDPRDGSQICHLPCEDPKQSLLSKDLINNGFRAPLQSWVVEAFRIGASGCKSPHGESSPPPPKVPYLWLCAVGDSSCQNPNPSSALMPKTSAV